MKVSPSSLWLFFCLLAFASVGSAGVVVVVPETPLFAVSVPATIAVPVSSLVLRATYDVTFSFPATTPATIDARFVGTPNGNRRTVGRAGERELLRTYQISFTYDPASPNSPDVHDDVDGVGNALLLSVSAVPESVSFAARGPALPSDLRVDIAVSRIVQPIGVPLRVVPLVVAACVVVPAAVAVSLLLDRHLPRFLAPTHDN